LVFELILQKIEALLDQANDIYEIIIATDKVKQLIKFIEDFKFTKSLAQDERYTVLLKYINDCIDKLQEIIFEKTKNCINLEKAFLYKRNWQLFFSKEELIQLIENWHLRTEWKNLDNSKALYILWENFLDYLSTEKSLEEVKSYLLEKWLWRKNPEKFPKIFWSVELNEENNIVIVLLKIKWKKVEYIMDPDTKQKYPIFVVSGKYQEE